MLLVSHSSICLCTGDKSIRAFIHCPGDTLVGMSSTHWHSTGFSLRCAMWTGSRTTRATCDDCDAVLHRAALLRRWQPRAAPPGFLGGYAGVCMHVPAGCAPVRGEEPRHETLNMRGDLQQRARLQVLERLIWRGRPL